MGRIDDGSYWAIYTYMYTCSSTILAFAIAKQLIRISKSVFSVVVRSTLTRGRSARWSCPIEALRYDKIHFNLLNDRSQLAMEFANVSMIWIAARKFGEMVPSPYYCTMKLSTSSGRESFAAVLGFMSVIQSTIS